MYAHTRETATGECSLIIILNLELAICVQICMYVCMYVAWLSHVTEYRLNRVKLPILLVVSYTAEYIFACPRSCLSVWSRETGSAVPSRVSLLFLHTQSKSGAYSRDSSRFQPWRPPYAIGSVPRLSGHAIAYGWRLLPRGSPTQGSSSNGCCICIAMESNQCAPLFSYTHYWYEVGMFVQMYSV